MLSSLKDEGKRVPKGLMGSQPHKFVRSRLNRAAELLAIGVTDLGVESVAGYDQIGIGEPCIDVFKLDFLLRVTRRPALFARSWSSCRKRFRPEANKTVTAGTLYLSRYVAIDKVPVNEFVDNTLGTYGVVRRYVVDSLV